MTSRFASIFGRKKSDTSSPSKDDKGDKGTVDDRDDTSSLQSDDHSSTGQSFSSENSKKKTGNIASFLKSAFKRDFTQDASTPGAKVYIEPTIDDLMKNLYIDTDELEHYCRTGAPIGSKAYSTGGSGSGLVEGFDSEDGDMRHSLSANLKIKKTAEDVIEGLFEGYFNPRYCTVSF